MTVSVVAQHNSYMFQFWRNDCFRCRGTIFTSATEIQNTGHIPSRFFQHFPQNAPQWRRLWTPLLPPKEIIRSNWHCPPMDKVRKSDRSMSFLLPSHYISSSYVQQRLFCPRPPKLPTAPHHQITSPRSHLSIFLPFMTQVLPLGIAMVELLPCLQFFCQLEGRFVSWAYDFERCGRGGEGHFVGRRLICSDFGGCIGWRPFYIAFGMWALYSRVDELCTLALGSFFDWIPTALCLFWIRL